jgi:uncharacterized protein YggE
MNKTTRLRRVRDTLIAATALTACAGPSAGAQVQTPPSSGPSDADGLGRLHVYDVAPEQAAAQRQEAPFIEVSGTGSVEVPPDHATVSFAMETRSAGAAQAASSNAETMAAVLAAVRGGSFPDLVLETFGYSLRPEYSATNNQRTREVVAYTALNNVRATTTDVEAVGRLIDLAIGAGANRVVGIGFLAENTGEAEREALALAVQNAREQAETIARALGHELGVALEVRGGAQRPVPGMAFRGVAMEMQAAPTPIESSDQTVSASVTIRFALGRELGG